MKWWQKTNAYEIYVSSFQDSDGNGIGDLNGIRSRLDYLASLGVGALWLTPVYASPMVDNGYDVADYYTINPLYGTMEDMDALIREADTKGIRIVMDLVYNHTSDQHAWFLESRKSKDNPKSNWYIWRDAKPDGSAPNNWRGIFGGSAWTWCEERQQYYLHTFASAQPDLNWENPEVRQALYDIANFWVNKGVGGFRMDAIPYIKKPADMADGPADASDGTVSVHNMTVNTAGILTFLREFKKEVCEGKDIFTVGEANGVGPSELKDWVGKNGVFDMIFEFSHVNLDFKGVEEWCRPEPWTLADLKTALTASQKATAENGWYPIYFENHDKPRSVSYYFPADADPVLAGKAMGTILLTLRGTPFLYQGQALGLRNIAWDSIDQYNEVNSRAQYEFALKEGFSEAEAMAAVHRFSRDNARTPMQWDCSPNAGFTSGTPWLPDPSSVLSWYRKLTAFRKENACILDGTYEELLHDHPRIYAYRRSNPEDTLIILVNFSGETAEYDPKAIGAGADGAEIVLGSYPETGETAADAAAAETAVPGRLRPYEAVILRP